MKHDPADPKRHVVVVGPTASGKSRLAMALARRLGDVEVVSVDSMCVYRHMDIGTAKPSTPERDEVPHHLLDLVEPDCAFSVAEFQRAARAALRDIEARGRRAVFVGGTGLYHRAVVDDLDLPPRFPEIAAGLGPDIDDEQDTRGLHSRLVSLDPVAAARIEPTNRRRIVRALEVTLGSGRPFSESGPGLDSYPPSPHLHVGVDAGESLESAIRSRVDMMVREGLVDEVRSLIDRFELSETARHALGYREFAELLEGRLCLDEATERTVVRTRRFAVRQRRWFRRDPRINWLAAGPGGSDAAMPVDAVLDLLVDEKHAAGSEAHNYRDRTADRLASR